MTFLKSIPVAIIGCLILSACASTPNPEKVCTTEWIGKRSDTAISRIETRSKSSLKAIKNAGKSWAKGKQPGLLQLLALKSSLNNLEKELTRGQGVTDLRTLAKTCNDPDIISKAMNNLLDRQGFSDDFKNTIKQYPLYERILEEITTGVGTET
ncbi:MAG: hypothetical protein ABJG88_07345 [Litorimonas sp.]